MPFIFISGRKILLTAQWRSSQLKSVKPYEICLSALQLPHSMLKGVWRQKVALQSNSGKNIWKWFAKKLLNIPKAFSIPFSLPKPIQFLTKFSKIPFLTDNPLAVYQLSVPSSSPWRYLYFKLHCNINESDLKHKEEVCCSHACS